MASILTDAFWSQNEPRRVLATDGCHSRAKANTTPLRYYDRNLLVTVQADASLRELGAYLIQQHKGKDQLIAFASKSLTDEETRYANIERELLAIVFACHVSAPIYSEGAS